MNTILITGGCGFIFSNFIKYMLEKYREYKIINLDALTYCGRLENTTDFKDNKNYKFIHGNICDANLVNQIVKKVDIIIHAAAESSVDRSILNAENFIRTNVHGTYTLLEAARKAKKHKKQIIYISTDEIYGSIEKGSFKETDKLNPSSPYATSKALADILALTYSKKYKLPVIITRTTNNFGPYQYPEKLIPLFITNLLEDKQVPVYGDGLQLRDWIYVIDNCEAIDLIMHKGKIGEIYNIGAGNEKTNIDITKKIIKSLDKDESYIQFVKDRQGHDRRYSLDITKIKKLGWKPKYNFDEALKLTIEWYKKNINWWKKIKSGAYLEYYKKLYKERHGMK